MQLPRFANTGKRSATHAVGYALVAALAFGAGLFLGGNGTTSAAVVSHLPFVGDNLDATPDSSVDLSDFWKAWNALNSQYVNTHASTTAPTAKEKLFGAIQGLAASYGDPYTVFFPPEEAKAFADNISGSFGGVGLQLDIKNGHLVVLAPLKGTPGDMAGVKPGDQIVAIDGKTTDGMPIEEAVASIRGPVGTVVTLTLVREGKSMEVKITRAKIEVPETEDGLDEKSGVYHITLYEFTANSAELFDRALKNFTASKSDKLVLDLRGNPGGYLDAAVSIASDFLPKGTPIVTEDFDGKQESVTHTSAGYDKVPRTTKIVVLVDAGSASASEILAGALQDNHAATVIGTRSFGKGSVQTLLDLGKGSLKITVARWVTPAGHWIMDQGITPDIMASSTPGATRGGEDPQMDRAIQFLTTGR
jgi:carboxyl-terminal processing protease